MKSVVIFSITEKPSCQEFVLLGGMIFGDTAHVDGPEIVLSALQQIGDAVEWRWRHRVGRAIRPGKLSIDNGLPESECQIYHSVRRLRMSKRIVVM